jgi:hypothetical protein
MPGYKTANFTALRLSTATALNASYHDVSMLVESFPIITSILGFDYINNNAAAYYATHLLH